MAIYLVRHGQTKFNEQERMQGQIDSLLNDIGFQQAKQIGQRLEGMMFSKIYTSDLKRALDTALVINRYLNIEVTHEQGLREIDLGIFEGKTMTEVKQSHQDILKQYDETNYDFKLHQGESLNQFKERIIETFEKITNNHIGEDILVVTHRGFIQILLCVLLKTDLNKRKKYSIDNGSITMITHDQKNDYYECVILNDTNHLK